MDIDIYSLVLGFIIPLSAFAINGEEKALLTGFALFGLVSLAIFRRKCRVRNSYSILLGIAGALIMPTTLSMIRVIFENPKERATALVWSIASSIGVLDQLSEELYLSNFHGTRHFN